MASHPSASPTAIRKVERPDPIVRADSMAHVVFERSNPDEMARFLGDFGLFQVEAAGQTRYFRGHGPAPYVVAIIPSDRDQFRGFGLTARSREDLEKLAAATNRPVEAAEGPGGGARLRLTDPDGIQVDFLHGATPLAPLPARAVLPEVNTPYHHPRVNAGVRTPVEPSPIFRLGHVVLQRPDFEGAADWYMRHFGFMASDVQALPDGNPGMGFFRLDRGEEPADHHSLALLGGPKSGLLHVAFETFDVESVGQGHQHLRAQGWTPFWGIGRHVLGSQVFDYWKDPVGDEWEHYADGDVFDASQPTGYHQLTRGTLWSWGHDLPDSMRPDISLEAIDQIHADGGFGAMDLERVRSLMTALQVKPRPWMR
jgi:hypothetical protein